MKVKRVFSMILALALMLSCLPAFMLEANASTVASGTCGDNVTWKLDGEGTLTISGSGAMADYMTWGYYSPWYDYRETIKTVVIEPGVTTVGWSTFADCTKVTSVSIPDSVTSIEKAAFSNCTSLIRVEIPDSVTKIADYAFDNCASLVEIVVNEENPAYCNDPYGVLFNKDKTTIIRCPGGKEGTYQVPATVTRILWDCFSDCSKLTDVEIPDSVTQIGGSAFANCTGLTNIRIPGSVTQIGELSFEGCKNLKEITFEGDVPVFGNSVNPSIFLAVTATAYYPADNETWTESKRQNYGGNITWVPYETGPAVLASGTCGDNVTWKLTEDRVLTISGTGPMYDYELYQEPYDMTPPPWEDCGYSFHTVVIEDGVTSVGAYAFCWSGVGNVTIGDSVTTIGDHAFAWCNGLYQLKIGKSVENIGEGAFSMSYSLSRLEIPDSVTSIGAWAFSEIINLDELTLGKSVAVIGEGAFASCRNVDDFVVPASVITIGDRAFESCGMSRVTFEGDAPNFGVDIFANVYSAEAYYPADNKTWTAEKRQKYGGNITWVPYETGPAVIARGTCGENVMWKLRENGVITIFGTGSMDDYLGVGDTPWQNYASSILAVVVEDGVTNVGGHAFSELKNLARVIIGNSVTDIKQSAFSHCGKLTEVVLGKAVANIDSYAFFSCAKLKELVIPASVTNIGIEAFSYTGLETIRFKGSAPTLPPPGEWPTWIFAGVTATAYYYPDQTWTEDLMEWCGGEITWIAMEGAKLQLPGEDFAGLDTVWIEGLPYPVQGEGDDRYVVLPNEEECYMVTYTYHMGDANDVHTQYPTGMKVYRISDGTVTYIPELDNLLQYSGSSIRITGKKGIRMITSLTKDNKAALTGKGLAGFTLVEYGTALCWASEIAEGDGLVLGRSFTRSNYAYRKGVADPVFASPGDLVQYTNVLVGFTLDQCRDDIAMRPYIILADAEGNQITLYGGTIYRSIGYIAYQNRVVFKPKTASYNYVWEIIHHVYGDKYDADYKG